VNVRLSSPGFAEACYHGWRKDFDGDVLSDDGFSIWTIVGRLVELVCGEWVAELVVCGIARIIAMLVCWSAVCYRLGRTGEDGGRDCQRKKWDVVLLGQTDGSMAGILGRLERSV